MGKSGIYKIENTVRGKIYVGSARNITKRKQEHIQGLNRGNHANPPLQRAWNKYGAESFTFEILEYCERDILRIREQHWLVLLKANTRKFGYNIASPLRQEAPSEKMSERHRAHWKKLSVVAVANRVKPMQKALATLRETSDLKDNLRILSLDRWQDPSRRSVYMRGHEKFWADPENKKRYGKIRSDNAKCAWSTDTERRAALKERRRKQSLDPSYIQSMKNSTSALWSDPEYRGKVTSRIKQSCNDPEYKRKLSERVKAYWAAKKSKEALENS